MYSTKLGSVTYTKQFNSELYTTKTPLQLYIRHSSFVRSSFVRSLQLRRCHCHSLRDSDSDSERTPKLWLAAFASFLPSVELTNEQTNERTNERTNAKRTNERQTNERMNKRTNTRSRASSERVCQEGDTHTDERVGLSSSSLLSYPGSC